MFDNLLQLVRENAGDTIINNAAIPNEKNEAAINTTTQSIIAGLQSQLSGGNMSNIMDMFNPQTPQNASVNQSISSSVVTNLVSNLGINQSQATGIAASLIPQVMGQLVNKTNDPNDSSYDLNSILSNLSGTGGSLLSGGFTDLLK